MADNDKAPKKKMYRVMPRIAYRYPQMVTIVPLDLSQRVGVGGQEIPVVSIALGTKEVKRVLPATLERPETEIISKPATQEQLKYLYEVEKHPHIEEYEE